MKKLIFLMGILLCFQFGFGQAKSSEPIVFKPNKYEFGRIKQAVTVSCEFVLKNVSNEPVIVERTWGSCGCATPDAITKPIMPGDSAKLKVLYNAESIGNFSKTIYIQLSGATNPKTVQITGVVMHPVLYEKGKKGQ